MCKELEAKGLHDPKYILTAFILKSTVYAYNVKELQTSNAIKEDVTASGNVTVNSEIFTVNGQDCIVNFTANGRNVTVNVTVKNKSVTVKMPQKTKDVLYFLLKEPELSAELLAEKMDCSSRTIKRHLAVLTKSKILKRIGSDKSGSWALAL